MLQVGNGGMRESEYRVHFSLWAIMKVRWAIMKVRWAIMKVRWAIMKVRWAIMKVRWAIMKVRWAIMKVRWAIMKVRWAIMKVRWAIMKVRWAIMKVLWAIMKVRWAIMKVRWTIMKVGWAIMKVRWAIMKVRWAIMKVRWAIMKVRQGHHEGASPDWLRSLCCLYETMSILSNKEVIAVNQDSLGVQARKVQLSHNSLVEVWAGPLSEGRQVVALVNRGARSENVTVGWKTVGLNAVQQMYARDLWEKSTLNSLFSGELSARVASHDVQLFVLKPVPDV
ncbi:unnamed protein product [Closterium sp. Yama58-4]|nr:unnamed protein product [Closterium sp. Yama58-4]